jgi:hypothetical protein
MYIVWHMLSIVPLCYNETLDLKRFTHVHALQYIYV